MPADPEVSVVFATHNREQRLAALLASLRAQTVDPSRFEVVVVDDGSVDGTPGVLAREAAAGVLDLRVVRHESARGPAIARNAGWRLARAPLVAFTDDDCRVSPGWLEAMLAAWDGDEARFVQGRTDPDPDEAGALGPFSRTLRIHALGPHYQTCNIAYPRALLERHGGFFEGFLGLSAEDADLAWRCLEDGAQAVFAPAAQVFHAVHRSGPVGRLRTAWRWHDLPRMVVRHPGYRSTFTYRIFWKKPHYILARAAIGLMIPWRIRWLRPLRFWCLAPLAPAYLARARGEGGGAHLAPYFVVHDAVEIAAMARGSARHRTLVI